MKKLTLIAAILALTPLTATAGVWTKLSTIGDEVIKPTNTYNVESAGWNVRVVEWTPKENPNVRCVFAGGSSKGGVSCYTVKVKK